jgi:uncharacterized protein (TIGR00369 family)
MPEQFAATRPDELMTPQQVLSMSGLEALHGMMEGRLAGPPIARTLGFRLASAEEGRVVFSGAPDFSVMNPTGSVHGGWYGTLLDSCMACAVMSTLPRGSTYTTLEYKVNIVRPVPPGTEVRAVGTVQHVGRSTGVARGEIAGVADGRVYATGSTTCLVMTG